jgi:hypothetical protein
VDSAEEEEAEEEVEKKMSKLVMVEGSRRESSKLGACQTSLRPALLGASIPP